MQVPHTQDDTRINQIRRGVSLDVPHFNLRAMPLPIPVRAFSRRNILSIVGNCQTVSYRSIAFRRFSSRF